MAVVYAGDLSQAMSGSAAISGLNADKEDALSMINAIQDFITSTPGRLVGDGYDSVRTHLQAYIPVLETRMRIADEIIAAIKSACGTMISYMDGEGKLDTDELEMYYTKLNNLIEKLNGLESAIINYDPDEAECSLNDLISAYNLCEKDIKEVNRMIDLLENLPAADAGAYGSYAGAVQGAVSSLSGSVSGVSTINI